MQWSARPHDDLCQGELLMTCRFCGRPDCSAACMYPNEFREKEKRGRSVDKIDALIGEDWEVGNFDANDAVLADRLQSVAQTQQMQRTDPMLAGNLRSERAHTIGPSVRMCYVPDYESLGLDEVWQDEIAEQVELEWEADMEDPLSCWNDATGMSTFSGQMGLMDMEWMGAGEALGVFQRMPDPDGMRPFPTALSIIDSTRLVTPPEFAASGSVKQGVRVNRFGAPITWYIADEHPYGLYRFSQALRSSRKGSPRKRYKSVPKQYSWGKPRVIHFFDRERAGQNRAKPHITAALRKMKGLSQFDDVSIQAAFRDAILAVWLEANDPNAQQAFSHAHGQNPAKTFIEMHTAAQQIRNLGNQKRTQLGGNDLTQLTAGETINSLKGGGLDKKGQAEFVKSYMWHFARALEIDGSSWSGDYTGMSFSSIRGAMINTFVSRAFKQHNLLQACGYPTFSCWFEEKIAAGVFKMPVSSTRTRAHLNYFYQNRRPLSKVDFYGPGQEFIDQVKGQKAWESRIACGMGTRTEYFLRHTNTTLRKFARTAKREEALLTNSGLGHMIKNTGALPQTANDRVAQDVEDD